MASVAKVEAEMRESATNVAYNDLFKVCVHYFGNPRQKGTSHAVFRTPWPGDPRGNIQNDQGKAKPYQVRQVINAIDHRNQIGKESR
ncbi:toxin HicA [Mycolicibacterium sp.]|uniref:toxin HicA n=1 Tax=Mycolicibacterium sp. TaxID=2320850 RepID=UPI00355EEFC7